MAYNPECFDCSEVDPVAPVIDPVYDPPRGGGLPPGGTTGQVLTKASDADGDAVWASGGGGAPVVVDTALSTTSTNPVQNRVIANALNQKASSASVTALEGEIATKASQADLTALSTEVSSKASQADLTALSAEVATKASQAALDGKVDKVDGMGLSQNSYTNEEKAKLAALENYDDTALSARVTANETAIADILADENVFVAEYGVTTAQEIIAYLDSTNEPFAPILIKRNGQYYTVTTAAKQSDTSVIIRSFATLSGDYYMFTYTVTNGSWSSSSHGFQKLLESGTNIKTVNGESLLGSGNIVIQGGGSTDWNDITNKPSDLVQDADYVHTDNNYTDTEKDKLAGLSNYDDTALAARVTALETSVAALQAQLGAYNDIRLTLTGEGGTETAYDVLGKAAPDPRPTNMFDAPQGVYDAEGNMILDLNTLANSGAIVLDTGDPDFWIETFDVSALPANAKGIVFNEVSWWSNSMILTRLGNADHVFENAISGQLDWIVIPDSVIDITTNIADIADLFTTIYYNGSATGAPWGQTSASIDTVGTPPWA